MKNLLTSCALTWFLLQVGSMSAGASPAQVEATDTQHCDTLAVPRNVDELGTLPGFELLPDELIEAVVENEPATQAPCPIADDPQFPDTILAITNRTGRSFSSLWYVADSVDPATGAPTTTLTNFDGSVAPFGVGIPRFGGLAFRIDQTGINQPLLSESSTADGIFAPGETWRFVIQDYANVAGGGAAALGSVGVADDSITPNQTTTPSTGSIIGVPFLQTGPLDHFQVYTSTGSSPPINAVELKDQFGVNTTALGIPGLFMVPANKNDEGLRDPFSHLTCYEITNPGTPGPDVVAVNQFGSSAISVGQAKYLCAPTLKLIDPGPIALDHYQCYDASGPTLSEAVSIQDQFQTGSAQLLEPFLFCNPVDKNGEGSTSGPVINIDLGDSGAAHVGDDGILSTPGNAYWNGVSGNATATGLLDETGTTTAVGILTSGLTGIVDSLSTNTLQSSGLSANTTGNSVIEIRDLVPGERYQVVVYGGENMSFTFQAQSGTFTTQCTSTPPGISYSLPGTAGGDYCFAQMPNSIAPPQPFDLGQGVFGFRILGIDGWVTGIQLTPEGSINATGHLTCYRQAQLGEAPGLVSIENQFFPSAPPGTTPERLDVGEAFGLCVPSEKTPVGPEPIDHFSVYRTGGTVDAPAVFVEDQFGAKTHDPTLDNLFLVPADKNEEGLFDPISHLSCHKLVESDADLPMEVTIENQFQTSQVLTLQNAQELCVPTEKLITPGIVTADHYKCYMASGSDLDTSIQWKDQFQAANVTLREPFMYCNPADKNGEGAQNTAEFLACYLADPALDPSGAEIPLLAPGPIDVVNQFNPDGPLNIGGPFAFCAPSRQISVPEPSRALGLLAGWSSLCCVNALRRRRIRPSKPEGGKG